MGCTKVMFLLPFLPGSRFFLSWYSRQFFITCIQCLVFRGIGYISANVQQFKAFTFHVCSYYITITKKRRSGSNFKILMQVYCVGTALSYLVGSIVRMASRIRFNSKVIWTVVHILDFQRVRGLYLSGDSSFLLS